MRSSSARQAERSSPLTSSSASSDALSGKLAVVTGASRGVGRAIALRLAASGAKLALCARELDGLVETVEMARRIRPGLEALAHACDLQQSEETLDFAARVEALGPTDVLVHNAGVVERARLDELSEAAWDHVLGVNLKAPFLLTRALLPAMRARKSGRIVFVSSISGTLGTPRLSAYCASKHGVIGLMRALAEEVRGEHIQVNAIVPGSIDTDMLKGSGFEPAMSPDEVAGVVLYLATSAPAAMTGSTVEVFG